ncbi:MAG TPA: histidine phosphatase family protein [Fimbriimonadales bacterium]|jgi:broad specificity phosphatase PhoE|nr:histidine phosphatase family protein [Fimbriimonadales bacterium]
MLRLLIIRHGQTPYNLAARNQGHTDIELDETGVAQAESLAHSLCQIDIDAIYSSDMKRALRTAQTFSDRVGAEVLVDKRLRERNYGSWEGMTFEEIHKQDEEAYRRFRQDPVLYRSGGGETGLEVFARVGAFLAELLRDRPAGSLAIFTHGGTGSAVIAALLHGSPRTAAALRLANCGITEITIEENGRRRLVRLDDCSHLGTSC